MLRTAEMVSPKHPDKICDQISDAILDEILVKDPEARVAIEAMGGHGKLVLMGELTTSAKVDYKSVVSKFIPADFELVVNIVEQSPEIARGVDIGGAGDQGIMVGYATNETSTYMPLEYELARNLCRTIYEDYPYDGKTQITLNGLKIESVVASFQKVKGRELKKIIKNWLSDKNTVSEPTIHANPAGDWNIGGFDSDVGLTGRKLAVDNYGPRIPLGGGAFSGKDATKVDRSGAYMARHIAVELLKKHNANEVYVTLAYAIGEPEPVQATATIDGIEQEITGYNLSPKGIIKFLKLENPQYLPAASFGHFGNENTWDK